MHAGKSYIVDERGWRRKPKSNNPAGQWRLVLTSELSEGHGKIHARYYEPGRPEYIYASMKYLSSLLGQFFSIIKDCLGQLGILVHRLPL